MKLAIVKTIAYGLGVLFILSICIFAYALTQKMRDDSWTPFAKQTTNAPIASHNMPTSNNITSLNWQEKCLNGETKIQTFADSIIIIQSVSCHFIDLIAMDGTWKHRITLGEERNE